MAGRPFYILDVFAEKKYPGVPQVVLHHIGSEPFFVGNLEIIPVRMMHYRLPVLGFRIGDFAYLTDANYIPEGEKEKLEQLRGWCRRGPEMARVTDIQAEWEEATGEFQDFSIRH